MVADIRWSEGEYKVLYPNKNVSGYEEKISFMVIFLYNLYFLVWIQHGYLVTVSFSLV